MKVNEVFYSIQGEGTNTGIPMVFVRLSGCNLRCPFCDTAYAFNDEREMTVSEIVAEAREYKSKWVCITGGEPFLQDLKELVDRLSSEGFKVQIETNGTIFQPIDCDWLVISPKKEMAPDEAMLEKADEIKLVIDSAYTLNMARELEKCGRSHSLQPESNKDDLTELCIDFIKRNPAWRLSMQLHKMINIR